MTTSTGITYQNRTNNTYHYCCELAVWVPGYTYIIQKTTQVQQLWMFNEINISKSTVSILDIQAGLVSTWTQINVCISGLKYQIRIKSFNYIHKMSIATYNFSIGNKWNWTPRFGRSLIYSPYRWAKWRHLPSFLPQVVGENYGWTLVNKMTSKCHEFTNKITAFVTSLLSMSYVIYTDGGYVIKT